MRWVGLQVPLKGDVTYSLSLKYQKIHVSFILDNKPISDTNSQNYHLGLAATLAINITQDEIISSDGRGRRLKRSINYAMSPEARRISRLLI